MTEANTKTTSNIIVVPSAWVAYDIGEMEIDELRKVDAVAGGVSAPTVAVMEALVMVGRIKRVAAVHTFNAMSSEEDESESPFTEHEQE